MKGPALLRRVAGAASRLVLTPSARCEGRLSKSWNTVRGQCQ